MAGELKPAQLALAQNHLLVGGATGVGTDVAVTGDIGFAAGAVTIPADRVGFAKMEAACRTWFNALRTWMADGMVQHGTVLISAVTDQFKTTTTLLYTIAGALYTKVATDNIEFSAADTINVGVAGGSFWGAWLCEIGVDGVPHTKPAAGLADQVYGTEAAALAALPAVTASHVQYAVITVQSAAGAVFLANTTALAPAAVVAANFYNLPAVKTLPAAL